MKHPNPAALALVSLFALSLAPVSARAANPADVALCLKQLRPGMSATRAAELAIKKAGFLQQAAAKNPEVHALSAEALATLRKEYRIVGVTGYSREFDASTPAGRRQEELYRAEVYGFLHALDPNRVLIASGATNTGVPRLFYEIAHELGFTTIGITALAATQYEPAYMDFLYVAEDENFGAESQTFLSSIDFLLALGGGNQAAREMVMSQSFYDPPIPLVAVANGHVDGASANSIYATVGTGTAAADEINARIQGGELFKREGNRIAEHANVLPLSAVARIYGSRRIIGFTGWSRQGPAEAGAEEKFRAFVRDFLDGLDPDEVVLATSGSHLGAERIVHEEAANRERPFRIIALTSDSLHADDFYPGVEAVFSTSKTWSGRIYGFLNHVCALVSGGGGQVVTEQLNAAKARGIPWVHVPGIFQATDLLVPDKAGLASDGKEAAKRILKGLGDSSGG